MASAPRMATPIPATETLAEFSSDVVVGLSQPGQKELPSKYLYDEVGSALFDVICVLPEYGLSRAGMRMLERHAADIVERVPGPVVVAELGSGSGQKTRWLLEALARRQRVNYYPIDISSSALFRCQQELGQIDLVSIVGFERAYLDGLREVAARRREGSACSFFSSAARSAISTAPRAIDSCAKCARRLREGDALLLATDLEKPVPALTLAYDDPAGVTAAFNKNLLARINRELDGDFDLTKFEHVARYDESERRVEMHLRSKVWQRVTIRKAGFRFYLREGETIWTESSHKYDPQEVIQMGERAGYRCAGQWLDSEWPFAQTLFFAG